VEDLADLLASVFEFLVGGMLFTAALVFLALSTSAPSLATSDQLQTITSNTSLAVLVLVAFAYVMGVVAESLARELFEPLLDRVTVRNRAFARGDDGEPNGALAERIEADATARGRRWLWWRQQKLRRVIGGDFSLHDCASTARERDRQRTKVMNAETLNHEVVSQLKRLRLERVFALSLAVAAPGLILRGDLGYGLVCIASVAVMIHLVQIRFRRYCDAIARVYRLDEEGALRGVLPTADNLPVGRHD
jgi:hypothetical protein